MDVNGQERRFNITLRYNIKVKARNMAFIVVLQFTSFIF